MIYADIIQVMDLILLTSIVDNRREIERIKQEIKYYFIHVSIKAQFMLKTKINPREIYQRSEEFGLKASANMLTEIIEVEIKGFI